MPLTTIVPIPEPPPIENKLEDRRLWIGNLDTCVSEYQLLKILEKYGRMEKFDLLFHRSGPLAGQPRGYAFVTFSTSQEALQMKNALDGKNIGTKAIVVRWAHNLNLKEQEKQKVELAIPALAGAKTEQRVSRSTKIQAIEAKLKMMEKSSDGEFILSDGPSGINVNRSPVSTSRSRGTKPFTRSRARPYARPLHRR